MSKRPLDEPNLCPLCLQSVDGCLQRHFDTEHCEFQCPFCAKNFNHHAALDLHVKNVHDDKKSVLICPVCHADFDQTDLLQIHIDSHFEASIITNKNNASKSNLLSDVEHEMLKERFGMTESKATTNAIAKLNDAYKSSKIDALTYHSEKDKIETKINSVFDDNSTMVKGIVELMEPMALGKNITSRYLCSKCNLYTSGFIDRGYGCGYRNTQMLLSCIREDPNLCNIIFNNNNINMPSVGKIQKLIEQAWSSGFDLMGKEQLGGTLFNTTKWIGASDVAAMFSYLKIKTQLVDIVRSRNSQQNLTDVLFDYVYRYFESRCPSNGKFVYPIFIQHDGHSRTIVGIENGKNKNLIIFDPGCNKKKIDDHVKYNSDRLLTLFRRGLNTFNRNNEYQLLLIKGKFDSDEHQENAKILKSTRIEC